MKLGWKTRASVHPAQDLAGAIARMLIVLNIHTAVHDGGPVAAGALDVARGAAREHALPHDDDSGAQ